MKHAVLMSSLKAHFAKQIVWYAVIVFLTIAWIVWIHFDRQLGHLDHQIEQQMHAD